MKTTDAIATMPSAQTRAVWLKRMHEWHWISSAIALLGILLFSVTGITLNHAETLESGAQRYSNVRRALPADLAASLTAQIQSEGAGEAEPSAPLRDWISKEFAVDTGGKIADWKTGEIYLSLPRPGGDAWLKIDLAQAVATYSVTDAGWIAYFNDLHKGRHTGKAWAWFIDILALACVVFSITGLVILKMHAKSRRLTWPLVGFGILIPFLIAVLLIH